MTHKEYINRLKSEWVEKYIMFKNQKYRVLDVDYNGMLLIDKKANFTATTAISISHIQK